MTNDEVANKLEISSVLLMKSSIIDLMSIKWVQDGSPNNWWNRTDIIVWTSAPAFSATIICMVMSSRHTDAGDEMWIHRYEPESKPQITELSPVKKNKFKS
jgi:hypothetical protein